MNLGLLRKTMARFFYKKSQLIAPQEEDKIIFSKNKKMNLADIKVRTGCKCSKILELEIFTTNYAVYVR